jgi:outer membrane protein assembly factor BamB
MSDVALSRRKLLGTASAAGLGVVGAGAILTRDSEPLRAQDEIEQGPATPTPLGDPIPPEFGTETNWPYEAGDLSATREARGTSISTANIDQLGDAWGFEVTTSAAFGALTANPIVVDDVVYIQDASSNVYALNKETGDQLWAAMLNDAVPSGGPNGIAVAYGYVFTTAGGSGDVIALNAPNGAEVWRTNIKGPLNEGITTAPLVFDSVVYVSTIPGTPTGFYFGGGRGVIHALDAGTGAVLWYWDTTTDNLWGNPTINSGGGFWHPPSVDADGKVYIGIGNAGPYPGVPGWPNSTSRPGDNDYANCILKMDPKTATLDWYYNVKPHDLFDLDNQLTPVLANVDGRDVVFTSGKHGIVVSLDRATGEVLWRTPVGTHMNDDAQEIPEGESLEVWPGTLGGVETPLAFSNNLVFAPVYEWPTQYTPDGFDESFTFDFSTARGVLVALNASDGTVAWQVDLPTGLLGGATVAGDVVFTSGLDGVIRGHNVADGTEVFRYQATAGINTHPAISGDFLIWPAGGPLLPSTDTWNPPPEPKSQVIALKIGGTVQTQPAPAATPEDGAATPEEQASPTANTV